MRIGLIGLGNMGYPLFQNLLKRKYNVSVLLETKNTDFIHQYNTYYIHQIDKFVNNNDKIISVLPNSKITLDVVNEINLNEINLKEINKRKYWIDLSSSNPHDIINLRNKLKNLNIEFLNSEIFGSTTDMKNGKLLTILSGSKLAYHNCFDLINIYSKHINYLPPKNEIVNKPNIK